MREKQPSNDRGEEGDGAESARRVFFLASPNTIRGYVQHNTDREGLRVFAQF